MGTYTICSIKIINWLHVLVKLHEHLTYHRYLQKDVYVAFDWKGALAIAHLGDWDDFEIYLFKVNHIYDSVPEKKN